MGYVGMISDNVDINRTICLLLLVFINDDALWLIRNYSIVIVCYFGSTLLGECGQNCETEFADVTDEMSIVDTHISYESPTKCATSLIKYSSSVTRDSVRGNIAKSTR